MIPGGGLMRPLQGHTYMWIYITLYTYLPVSHCPRTKNKTSPDNKCIGSLSTVFFCTRGLSVHSPVCVPNRRHFSGLPLRVDLVARVRKRWFQALEILQFLVLYPSKYLVYFFCCRKTWRGTQTLSYTSVDLHQPGNLTFKRLKTNKNFKFQRRGPPQRMARHTCAVVVAHSRKCTRKLMSALSSFGSRAKRSGLE